MARQGNMGGVNPGGRRLGRNGPHLGSIYWLLTQPPRPPVDLCFVPAQPTKHNRPAMKPFSVSREGVPKPLMVTNSANKTRANKSSGRTWGPSMIKALSAIAVAAFVAAALTVLPGFAPQVSASVPQALAKGDRLDVKPVGRDCSENAWPNFEASCLRIAGSKITVVRQARFVTTDRTQ